MEQLKITRPGAMAFALALVTIVLDRMSKAAVLGAFAHHCAGFVATVGTYCRIGLSRPLNFTMVWNPGMSFGLGRAHGDVSRWLFALFALAVSGVIAWYARRTERPVFAIAAGLLMGGALGNVFDRLRYGAVVDFIDVSGLFGSLFPWIFNLADSAITVGAAILLVEAFVPGLRSRLDSKSETGN